MGCIYLTRPKTQESDEGSLLNIEGGKAEAEGSAAAEGAQGVEGASALGKFDGDELALRSVEELDKSRAEL